MRSFALFVAFTVALVATSALAAIPFAGLFSTSNKMANNNNLKNADLIATLSSLMGVEQGSELHFPDLKKKFVAGVLDLAHTMLHPTTLAHMAMRASLPEDLQKMVKLAAKLEKAPTGAHKTELQLASAQAFMAAYREMQPDEASKLAAEKYPYFAWIPQWAGDAQIGSSASFATNCHGEVKVAASGSSDINVTTSVQKSGFLCSDFLLLLAGAKDFRIQIVDSAKPIDWSFSTASYNPENTWYLNRHGVRVLKFPKNVVDTVGQVIATVTMLAGFAEGPTLPTATLEANMNFMRDYVEFNTDIMGPKTVRREGGSIVGLDAEVEASIPSGSAIIVARLDGVDPMLSWASGWTSGHSTIAMRNESGHLHVCESTTKDAYWPHNGIQCTPYRQWIGYVEKAQMAALLAPLSPAAQAKFDAKKAWAKFKELEGTNYGFTTLLFGWIDTATQNLPCIPPDFKTCLMREAVEQLAFILDKLMGNANTNIFRQALAHRAGTPLASTVINSFYTYATKTGKTFSDLYSMPEQGDWKYNMTLNDGRTVMQESSVCCVFVSRMWLAGGLYADIGNQVSPPEQALWDIFSLDIFDKTKMGDGRPEACRKQDPDNQLCQLTGIVTLHAFPNFNTRKNYPNMGNGCPSEAPMYPNRENTQC